jgi:branched-chain amino acid transport system substrate-binding protein
MKRGVVWSVAFCLAAWGMPASAQQLTDGVVKLGVLTDMSSLYSDINGPGAVIAVQMAIEDFGGSIGGKRIEIVQADVQNKADVAATIAGRWYDTEQVDVILGAGAS